MFCLLFVCASTYVPTVPQVSLGLLTNYVMTLLKKSFTPGLIDSLAVIEHKNDSLGKILPHKKNLTSKYDCLLNKRRPPLETAVDAHKPVKYQLKASLALFLKNVKL